MKKIIIRIRNSLYKLLKIKPRDCTRGVKNFKSRFF